MSYNTGDNFTRFSGNDGQRNNPRMSPFFPLLFAVMLGLGVVLGYNIQPNSASGRSLSGTGKINHIMSLIDAEYVDTVNANQLIDQAIVGMLQQLDPHSVYMNAEMVKQSNEELSGSFGGVGIQFLVLNDTVVVTHLVPGGPAEKRGIKPYDRIVGVNKKKFTFKNLDDDTVRKNLRGPVGSSIQVKLFRPSEQKVFSVNLTRGIIPVSSVDCSVMLNKEIGLIRISSFGENTYVEFLKAAKELRSRGMKKMILDLRDNGGGYLLAAQNIVDQFLPKGVKIVYTEGKKQGRYDYMATSTGDFEQTPLVVLVNHNSASASEIVAGAIQDNDRGAIVGRRTFGKGLVQQQFGTFSDGSALRLTVSRYYTPSGRCIQRPYGNGIDYFHDSYNRYENNEFYTPDSARLKNEKQYKTIYKKRIVYGGGGIMPDYFVPYDTSFASKFYTNILNKNCINKFALKFTESNSALYDQYKNPTTFNTGFLINDQLWSSFLKLSNQQGVVMPTPDEEKKSREWISALLKAEVARLLYNSDGYFLIRMLNDNEVNKAMNSFWK